MSDQEQELYMAMGISELESEVATLLTRLAAVEKESAPNMFNDEGCQYKCHVVDALKARMEEIASVPCICEPCYKDRGLIQPDCFYCHVGIIATDALKECGE